MRGLLLMTIGLCLAGAYFAENADYVIALETKKATATRQNIAPQQSAFAARSYVIPRHKDGHFYVDAKVEGRSVSFLLDTGASTVLLSSQDAARLGHVLPKQAYSHKFSTANGVTYAAMTTLDQIRIGGHDFANVEAYIIPDGLTVSLLGQSILRRFESVQMQQDRLELRW